MAIDTPHPAPTIRSRREPRAIPQVPIVALTNVPQGPFMFGRSGLIALKLSNPGGRQRAQPVTVDAPEPPRRGRAVWPIRRACVKGPVPRVASPRRCKSRNT